MTKSQFFFSLFYSVWCILIIANGIGTLSLIAVWSEKNFIRGLKVKVLYPMGMVYIKNKGTANCFYSFISIATAISIFYLDSEPTLLWISIMFFIIDNWLYLHLKPKKNNGIIQYDTERY